MRGHLYKLLLLLMLFSLPIEAKEKSYAMSLKIFKELEKSQQLAEEENYDEAISSLTDLLERRSSMYEKAQIHNLMGSIYYRKNDYESALTAYIRILESAGKMPLTLHQQTLKTITQLNMMVDNYHLATTYCQQLIDISEPPDQKDFALLAQSYFKLEDWQNTKKSAFRGIELAYESNLKPDENLLLLLNAAHFESNELAQMPMVLDELIKYYPKTTYVLYLASIYGQLERYDKQLVLMEALYDDNKLNDSNLVRNLVTLYLSEGIPFKAATTLQRAFDTGLIQPKLRDYKLLAQAWLMAAERLNALVSLGLAAQLTEDGEVYLQQAYLHFDMAQWKQAEQAIDKSLEMGLEPKQTGEAWLLLGMTRFKRKQFTSAIDACQKAKAFDNSQKHAEQWIAYISNEMKKYKNL